MTNTFRSLVVFVGLAAAGSQAAIVVDSVSDANPGSSINLNVNIDSEGNASTPSPWFNVSGSAGLSGAAGSTIGISMDAMKNASTNAVTLGDKLVDGGIDRDGNGFMGVSDNPNGGGIGADGSNHEGLSFIIDEITDLPSVLAVQITGIDVQNIGRINTDPYDESFTVVNLATRESMTVHPQEEEITAGTIDVSSLNLIATAGSTNPVAALFSGDVGGFRVNGLTFDFIYADDPEALLPPASVSADPVNSGSVLLEWSAGQNAVSYTIYRSTVSGEYGVALQTGITGLTYTDATAENFTTYYYSVVSVSGSTESILSGEVEATPYDTGDTVPPAAPTSFAAKNPYGAWVELSWNDSGDPDVKSYSVYRSTVSGSYGDPIASDLTGNSYTDEEVEIGTTYYYVIRAVDYAGLQSTASIETSVKVMPLTGPKNVFFVLDTGEIYAFTSVASNGISCMGQGHVTNGVAVATNPDYGEYQGFASVPDGRIYGINSFGDVMEWPDLTSWIDDVNAVTVSSEGFGEWLSAEVHGFSYDLNTKGFYSVQGSGTYEGDIGEYPDLAALLANTPTTNYTASYNGNVCNFYYPFDDAPHNYGSYANAASGALYFQIAGNGNLEGWLTLADYVKGTPAETFRLGGFSTGVTTVGAFATFSNGGVGRVSIGHVDGQIIVTADGTSDGTLYVLQSKSRLVDSGWVDVATDLESINGYVSVSVAPADNRTFYRIRVK
ncbi:MAG: hypothetical protein JXR25_11455 [Pontiellaceae bacterium]|nr:hypothetical protein [Pontiellaceae bacterium]MBN2785430.1 hypothetical protein [Pontiellaceae bacterium]